jgi:hypothetical protein
MLVSNSDAALSESMIPSRVLSITINTHSPFLPHRFRRDLVATTSARPPKIVDTVDYGGGGLWGRILSIRHLVVVVP